MGGGKQNLVRQRQRRRRAWRPIFCCHKPQRALPASLPGIVRAADLSCLPACLPARPPACPVPTHSPPAELTEKRKTYTFFLLTDDLAAANSSGGAKTLMARVRP